MKFNSNNPDGLSHQEDVKQELSNLASDWLTAVTVENSC